RLDIRERYPTRRALSIRARRKWNRVAKREHQLGEERCKELWEKLSQPQLKIREHVVRAKSQLLLVLVIQLRSLTEAVKNYSEEVERFFASMPAAKLVKTLPGGKGGITVPMLLAELGDA